MCCSTGVCGPKIDPGLQRFAADLGWLKSQGITVTRYNLAQQPLAFAENEIVMAALSENDEDCLPLILVDGHIVSRGKYPSREELAASLCISMVARNEAPREKAPALAELSDHHTKAGAFKKAAPWSCCGPGTEGGKTSGCCQ
jgi:hypothetical protein